MPSCPSFRIRSQFALTCIGALAASVGLLAPDGRADVVINELVAGSSDRLLRWSAAGVPKVGTGKTWYEPDFRDASWADGSGKGNFFTTEQIADPTLMGPLADSAGDGTEAVLFRDTTPITPASPSRYMRVRTTLPP